MKILVYKNDQDTVRGVQSLRGEVQSVLHLILMSFGIYVPTVQAVTGSTCCPLSPPPRQAVLRDVN